MRFLYIVSFLHNVNININIMFKFITQ